MSLRAGLVLALVAGLQWPAFGQPSGFFTENVASGWVGATGLTFDANGRLYVYEKAGRVWIVENGVRLPSPLIDISDEVGDWRDYGLLGFALHPNFLANGYIYLYYVVDHHHLFNAGTPSYNPAANEYFMPSIGRITRYTANIANNFQSVEPNSRLVLVGSNASNGFPIVHQSHGTGSLMFGTDGTLLAVCGDAASYETVDAGGSVGGSYAAQALAEGILQPKEDIGAFRAQLVDSLCGKVVRLDPVTGNGVPTNPYFDPMAPASARSRVWALGLRNPCRTVLRPGTGSHDPTDGDPGVLYIGDVGWNSYEDLHVCDGPGLNFGWPLYEGHTVQSGYVNLNIANLDAPNPLFGTFVPGTGQCNLEYFRFRDLLAQETLDPNASIRNPCNPSQEITTATTWFHRRPAIDWQHGSGPARIPTFNGFNAATVQLQSPQSPVPGPFFGGNCSIGGVWYTGQSYPAAWQNTYFHGDFSSDWIRAFKFDANDQLLSVEDFIFGANDFVAMGADPLSGDLYYIQYGSLVRRLRFQPSGNQPPLALASSDVTWGAAPLAVQFTGSGSTDPEGQPLTYHWDFGDGASSTAANPSHTFVAPAGVPTRFDVTLTVTDAGSATSMATLIVSANNSPPQVTITNPSITVYPIGGGDQVYDLEASLSDAEHAEASLVCAWRTTLHHNDHTHPEPLDPNCTSTTVITPVGCDGQTYFYEISLTVTDPAGLTGSDTVLVFPDCPNNPPVALGDSAAVQPGGVVAINVLANDSDQDGVLVPGSLTIVAGPSHGSLNVSLQTGIVVYTHGGGPETSDSFAYTVADDDGADSNVAVVTISTMSGLRGDYFANAQLLGSPTLTRVDATLDFDWGNGAPGPGLPADLFSVRWSGQLEPQHSELYTLRSVSDDGVRVWINGSLVIDAWIDQAPTEHTGTVALTAGVWSDVVVEYYENGGGAVAQLRWSSASQVDEVIPSVHLRPAPGNQPPAAIDDQFTVGRGLSADLPVLANDLDVDGVLDPASVQVVVFPQHGAVAVDPVSGSIDYTNDGSVAAVDTFTYRVSDDDGAPSNIATVVIDVFAPPTLSVQSPTPGASVATTFALEYQISGDIGQVDHWHYSWDGGPTFMVHDLTGTWMIVGAPLGVHVFRMWLVDAQHQDLPYPEAEVFLTLTVCDDPWIRGDGNDDGSVNIADALSLLAALFQGAPPPVPAAVGDVNSDGGADIADVIFLLQYLFSGGAEPAHPFPNPGC